MRPTHRNDLCPADKPVEDNPLSIQKVPRGVPMTDDKLKPDDSIERAAREMVTSGQLRVNFSAVKVLTDIGHDPAAPLHGDEHKSEMLTVAMIEAVKAGIQHERERMAKLLHEFIEEHLT